MLLKLSKFPVSDLFKVQSLRYNLKAQTTRCHTLPHVTRCRVRLCNELNFNMLRLLGSWKLIFSILIRVLAFKYSLATKKQTRLHQSRKK